MQTHDLVDGSFLIIKWSGDMVPSYFQITKMAQADCSNTNPYEIWLEWSGVGLPLVPCMGMAVP